MEPVDARRPVDRVYPVHGRRQHSPLAFELQGLRRAVLILLVVGAAWGETNAAPFSHKLHLKLISQCTTCHTTAEASTKPEDNLLPVKQVCVKCHADVTIPAPPTTLVAHFSHAQHLKMGN